MRIEVLDEPELEFGGGRHIDVRFGLTYYGPVDITVGSRPTEINVGLVGSNSSLEGLCRWLECCRREIPAKESKLPHLFPRFPGFNGDDAFASRLVLDPQLRRSLRPSVVDRTARYGSPNGVVTTAVDEVISEFEHLVEFSNADVLVCALPSEWLDGMQDDVAKEDDELVESLDFHHLLKARAQRLGRPVQIVLPSTYDDSARRSQKRHPERTRQLQDPATRAWNLHTALYYKAGGIPWRLVRESTQLPACYIGVSFYNTRDRAQMRTSVAQVFNQRGEGVIVRGATVQVAKDDRQPHLSGQQMRELVSNALGKYRECHFAAPARVVVHKTSSFSQAELDGANQAFADERVELGDLLSFAPAQTRLYRLGAYPPLRGTFWSLDEKHHILYTRGSVSFFETYPGMYVPRPELMRCESVTQTPPFLAQEVMALTKMNWNNTQFDGGTPITIRAARHVGAILRYIDDDQRVEPRYSFYM